MSQGVEKRIYVVVANTVQHPLVVGKRCRDTRTIAQVPGRQIAQACHAIRRMGHSMVIRAVLGLFSVDKAPRNFKQALAVLGNLRSAIANFVNYQPITTIILSCRDSYELEHCYQLLRIFHGVEAFKFNDTNPEVYGDGEVTTAFATVPADPYVVDAALSYLPLWGSEALENKG